MSEVAAEAPVRAERGLATVAAGLSAAGCAVPQALFAALPGLVFAAGYDHLAYGLGLLAGVVLAGQLIGPHMPHVAATGSATVTGALHARFGRSASISAAIVIVLVVLPLIVTELSLAGTLAAGFFGSPYLLSMLAAFLIAALVATALGDRAFAVLSALAFVLFIASLLVPLAMLLMHGPGSFWPHEAHGAVLEEVRALEEKLIEDGRVDFDTFSTHATPFARFERLNVLALIASLALGTAAMSPLLYALATPGRRGARRLAGAWAALFVMIPLVAVPPLAAFAKLAIYSAFAADTPLTSLPAWLEAPLAAGLAHIHGTSIAMLEEAARAVASGATDAARISEYMAAHTLFAMETRWAALPGEVQDAIIAAGRVLAEGHGGASAWQLYQSAVAPAAARAAGNEAAILTQASLAIDTLGLWLALPALAKMPAPLAPLLGAGPLAAALVMASALMRSLLHLGAGAPEAGQAGPRRRSIILVLLAAAAVTAASAAPLRMTDDLVTVVVASLSLAAGGLFPVLAAGLAWKRTSAAAAAAAIIIGAGLTLYYDVGIQVSPAAFYETWPSLSNAGEAAIEEFDARNEAVRVAEGGEAKAAAQKALDDWARGTPSRPGLANWFGIESSLGAVFGVPAGFAALFLLSVLTRRRKA